MAASERSALFSGMALFIGSVIGAGIFALPYGFAQVGIVPSLIILALTGVLSYFVLLLYTEVVLRTKETKQLVGLSSMYLGKRWRAVAFLPVFIGSYGAMLAYIIGVSTFFRFLIGERLGASLWPYALIFLVIVTVIIVVGLRAVIAAQKYLTIGLLLALIVLIVAGAPQWDVHTVLQPSGSVSGGMGLFGMLLFAFGGMYAIVDLERALRPHVHRMRDALRYAYWLIGAGYGLFSVLIVGISGTNTSQQAIEGLATSLGSWVLMIGALFGSLAMTGSFLSNALALKVTLKHDLKLPAWAVYPAMLVPPVVLLAIGVSEFATVIEVLGAVIFALVVIIVSRLYVVAKVRGNDQPPFSLRVPTWAMVGAVIVCTIAAVWQIGTVILG